jgi:hypothetical protein
LAFSALNAWVISPGRLFSTESADFCLSRRAEADSKLTSALRPCRQPMMIVPTAITAHANTFRTVSVSPKKKYPINAANNTLVSRNADTAPMGAADMA